MKKITLLFVHHSTKISGAEISLLNLITNIDRSAYNIIIALPDAGPLYSRLTELNVLVKIVSILRLKKSINPFRLIRYVANIFLFAIEIIRLVRKYNVDLIHANTTNAYIYTIFPARLANLPIVWHIRDSLPYSNIFYLSRLSKTQIISVSNCIIPDKFKRDPRLRIVPNAVTIINRDLEVKIGRVSPEYLPPDGVLLVAQVGQLIPIKNHKDFILTASLVVKENKNVHFLIVGDDLFGEYGKYKRELHQLLEDKELTEYFTFISYQDNIDEVLESIDILFHPAINEPFGRIIIEAMMYQKVVIAINNYGPAEIIKNNETGFLLRPHDITAMSLTMIKLLNNEQLRLHIGFKASQEVSKRYTVKEHMQNIEGIYKRALSA